MCTYPPTLAIGDSIAIISPAGKIEKCYIEACASILLKHGYHVQIGQNCTKAHHRFAGTEEERLADLQWALDHPDIKAIFCSRGGYGTIHLVSKLDLSGFQKKPKWLIGFSDITILHNIINNLDINSLHADMPLNYISNPNALQQILKIISGKPLAYTSKTVHPESISGTCEGILTGGNLSILCSLANTPFSNTFKNRILFIEDVAESYHHIERMLYGLKLSGRLSQLTGMIVGQFSNMTDDPSMGKSLEEIIANLVREYHYPVLFDFPAGHITNNQALVMGAPVGLTINSEEYHIETHIASG